MRESEMNLCSLMQKRKMQLRMMMALQSLLDRMNVVADDDGGRSDIDDVDWLVLDAEGDKFDLA